MKITLYHRMGGIHYYMKHMEIPGVFNDYVKIIEGNWVINEELLITKIPQNFVPVLYKDCLLKIDDSTGSTGLKNVIVFKPWSKYYDCYSLGIDNVETAPATDTGHS